LRQSTVTTLCLATLCVLRPAVASDEDGVRLERAWYEESVRRLVHAAASHLANPSCTAMLASFRDRSGRSLAERLGDLDLDAPDYARSVLFYDGANETPCLRPRVYAFTVPGSRVVRTCPSLGRLAASDPREAEAVVIHELLHTLGLGEDPPASEDITAAVEVRCLSS
jgi:hypothetical protein